MKTFLSETLVLCVLFRYSETKIRYNTYQAPISRATIYDPQVVLKSCLLKPEPGPCRGRIKMYHFNPKERNCTIFDWGGCQGNGNRFDTEEECRDTCLSKPDEKRKRPRFCALSFDYGYCFGSLNRYYYDHMWKVCKKAMYSGCGGNKNNFYSMEQCDAVCRLGRGSLPEIQRNKNVPKKILIINPPNTTPYRGKDQGGKADNSKDGGSTTKKQ